VQGIKLFITFVYFLHPILNAFDNNKCLLVSGEHVHVILSDTSWAVK